MVSLIPQKKIDQLPLAEIKWGTNNFDEENLIGYGGFGQVYKGKLADYRGYGPVAVKRLRDDSRQGRFEFNTEISILSIYQHPNIVSLIGYCEEADELILVYEYAVNHSLDNCLKPNTEKTDILTWERRLKICISVASALECLHEGIGYHNVIHRDLKSGNILLDEKWDAKVTDFGLSKESHVNQTITYVISGSAGTHVYIDPDYKESKILRIESDVYSFGVVLFELLCGRMAFVREYTEEEQSLPEVARRCFKEGRIEEIVDPSIIKQIHWSSLSTFSAIAHRCIETKHERRPKIPEVIADLKNALKFQERRTIIPLVPNQQEHCRIFDKVLGNQETSQGDVVISRSPRRIQNEEWRVTVDKVLQKRREASDKDEVIIPSPTTRAGSCKQGDDMNLEDSMWEDKLPSDYQEILNSSSSPVVYTTKKQLFSILSAGILVDGGKRFIWLNRDGKKCLMVSAAELLTEQDTVTCWKTTHDARFPKVAEIKFSKFNPFRINTTVRIKKLPLGSIYTAYVVYKLVSIDSSDSESDLRLWCIPPKGTRSRKCAKKSERKSDGWTEADLWSFMISHNENGTTFNLELGGDLHEGTGHILLQGIEFRSTNTDSLLSKMPHNFIETLKRSDYKSESDISSVLSRGIMIDNDTKYLWVNEDGKTSLFLPAKYLQEKYEWIKPTKASKLKQMLGMTPDVEWTWTPRRRSRFPLVAVLGNLNQIVLDASIDIELLSPNTTYDVYLVFDYQYGFTCGNIPCKLRYKGKTEELCVSHRADLWMEAWVESFTTPAPGPGSRHIFLHGSHSSFGVFVQGLEFRAQGNDVIVF